MLALAPAAKGDPRGHIQVLCEAGVQILLDGVFRDSTDADVGGLILQDVAAGRHVIRAVKRGCDPQDIPVRVREGRVLIVRVRTFRPRIRIVEEGRAQEATLRARLGTLVLQSLPVVCKIDIPDLALFGMQKTKDRWIALDVRAGTYTLTARALGRTLTAEVTISSGRATKLMLNFLVRTVAKEGAIKVSPLRIERGRDRVEWLGKRVRMRAYFPGPPGALACRVGSREVLWFVKRSQTLAGQSVTLLSADERAAVFAVGKERFRLRYTDGAGPPRWTALDAQRPVIRFAELLDGLLIAPEPVAHAVGGRIVGLRLRRVPSGSNAYRWGFRAGDVITALNGHAVRRRIQILELREALKQTPAVRVVFLRKGARRELVFPVGH